MSIDLLEDFDDIDYIELSPNIHVYRNMLKDPKWSCDVIKRSENNKNENLFAEWTPWAKFGTYTHTQDFDNLQIKTKNKIFQEEFEVDKEIRNSYLKALSHYVKTTNTTLPKNSYFSGSSYCKYYDQVNLLENNMTMQYHTDYIISQSDMPGPKFHTTCTFYVNDDYKGGEIEFYINGKFITHKPQAGDIVIFPSTPPYYHGVKLIESGNKFMIRNFVMTNYSGSKEWLDNQNKYGAYNWAKMEIERVENEDDYNMVYISKGKEISFDEAEKQKSLKYDRI